MRLASTAARQTACQTAAAQAFEAALAEIPNDGRALSELGWVAFQSGD